MVRLPLTPAELERGHRLGALLRRARGARSIEVRRERHEAFQGEMARRLARTVWQQGGCVSYYQGPDRQNPFMWPGSTAEYWARTKTARPADYRFA